MNILFINSIKMFGGGEIWLFNTMKELLKRQHTVHLLCRPGVPLEDRAKRMGFSVHTIKMKSDFDPVVIFKTAKLIKKLKIDVVCTNMDKELRFGGLAAKIAGVNAIIPRRGIDYPLKNKPEYRFSYNFLASGIIANSESTKRSLLKNAPWLNPDKIKVIYNGIDFEKLSGPAKKDIRKEFNISKEDFVVGFVGQLNERKGIDTLVRSFINAEFKKAALLIVGDGDMEHFLKRTAEQSKAKIIFTGFRDDIHEIMKAIDVLALPSLWEGFGIVLIEAMAAGKPVITTNVSNMPEIVRNNQDGILIPPNDETKLTEAIKYFYNNPAQKAYMGKTAQEKVKEFYTIKRMVDETESYFYHNYKIYWN